MKLSMARWPTQPVSDFTEASRIYCARRDASGEGASTFDDGHVLDDAGAAMGRISYNGRVWGPGTYGTGDTPLWDNRTGETV
jgi:hypothetical protein